MTRNRKDFLIFLTFFFRYAPIVRHVITGLLSLILLGAAWISHLENLTLGEAIYFAFITGLTIGYGDIEPVTAGGRALSVVLGIIGVLFTGMIVAVATRALADTVKTIGNPTS